MQITLSPHMMLSIKETVLHYSLQPLLLDIYKTATAIQNLHPDDNVALEDIMSEILHCVGSNTAISFVPPEFEIQATRGKTTFIVRDDGSINTREFKFG